MPSDLTGFNAVDYDEGWANEEIDAAMGTPTRAIRVNIEKIESLLASELPLEKLEVDRLLAERNQILEALFAMPDGTRAEHITEYLKVEKGVFQYHIDSLIGDEYINDINNETLVITQKGRKQVVEVIRQS